MLRVREHIHGLHFHNAVFRIEQLEVASLSGRVTTHVNNALRSCEKDGIYHVLMHTRTRWVGDDDVGLSVFLYEFAIENILHIASKEQGIVDAIDFGIHFRILDGFGNILNTYHLASLPRHEIGNGSSTRIEVVNQFISCELRKITSHLIEVECLVGIRLIERLWPHLELQSFHLLVDVVFPLEHHHFLVAKCVVALVVIHIEQRGDFGKSVSQMLHESQGLCTLLFVLNAELHQEHQLTCVGIANHQTAKQSLVVAQIVECQPVLQSIRTNIIADAVVDVVHQPAFLDVENLVESTCDVESHSIHLLIFHILTHFLFGEPTLVRKTEFELVAISRRLLTPHDG